MWRLGVCYSAWGFLMKQRCSNGYAPSYRQLATATLFSHCPRVRSCSLLSRTWMMFIIRRNKPKSVSISRRWYALRLSWSVISTIGFCYLICMTSWCRARWCHVASTCFIKWSAISYFIGCFKCLVMWQCSSMTWSNSRWWRALGSTNGWFR